MQQGWASVKDNVDPCRFANNPFWLPTYSRSKCGKPSNDPSIRTYSDKQTMRITPKERSDFRYFLTITTRWMDNDVYGHVNNVVYYSWFDTVVNQFLVANGVLDIQTGETIGLVVETQCTYLDSITFPDTVVAGLAVGKLGNSSVRYEVGIFRNDEESASAQGQFVHVYVNRQTRRPVPLPSERRALLQTIMPDQSGF